MKRSGEAGTPFLDASRRAKIRRASGQQPGPLGGPLIGDHPGHYPAGCPVHIRTANRTPETNTKGPQMTPLRSRPGRESSRQYQRSSVSSGKALRGERGGVHPIPAGRLVRQPPIGVFRRRRWALRATVSDVTFSSVIRAELHRHESVDAAGVLLTRAQGSAARITELNVTSETVALSAQRRRRNTPIGGCLTSRPAGMG